MNPNLPLMKEKPLRNKLQRTFEKVIAAERSKASKHKNSVCWLENNLLKLFDISTCRCELPLLNCDDRFEVTFSKYHNIK